MMSTPCTHKAGQRGQHWPLASDGLDSASLQAVGKQKTSGQKVLGIPPALPVAPVTGSSALMVGWMHRGQQWPGTSVTTNWPGQTKVPHAMLPQASLIDR